MTPSARALTDRRTFLLAAASALTVPDALHAFGIRSWTLRPERPSLDLALACARWIDTARVTTPAGAAWPADPRTPATVSLDFYNGTPGVVYFLTVLAEATGDDRWRTAALAGCRHLLAEVRNPERTIDPGLYTGRAGIAAVVDACGRSLGDPELRAAADRILDGIVSESAEGSAMWTDVNDVISGASGTGIALLALRPEHDRYVDRVAQAGLALLERANPVGDGLMWHFSGSLKRNYPNFSHGTAGVSYFLATLYGRTRDRRFLEGAEAGARYLQSVARPTGNGALVHHHDGGGEDLFYLSWCHGPAGTARLFHRLHRVTEDTAWLDWIGRLNRGLWATGVPETRTPGFWNNMSQCCGNCGVADYMLELREAYATPEAGPYLDRMVSDLDRRATTDTDGRRWVQAEHRVQPENVVAQTGYMQGAAGAGMLYLRLNAAEQGRPWKWRLPDNPW